MKKKFSRIVFGLRYAGQMFQRLINEVLPIFGLDFAFVYFDILVESITKYNILTT